MNSSFFRGSLTLLVLLASAASAVAQFDDVFPRRSRTPSRIQRSGPPTGVEKVKNDANQAYARRDYNQVIKLTSDVLAQSPQDHAAYYLRASARCELGFATRDKKMIRDGIGDSRESLRYGGGRNKLYYIPYIFGMTKLADVEGKKSHAETALEIANQALGRPALTTEERAHLTYQRAGTHAYLSQFDAAIADYDAAIQTDRQLMSAYLGRGELYTFTSKLDKARESYGEMVKVFGSSGNAAMAYDYRGVFFQQHGTLEEALADFTRAIQIDPKYHSAYVNRGFTLLEAGRAAQAEADFSLAIQRIPNEPMFYTLRSSARLAQGRAQEAVGDQQQAVNLLPGAAPAYADLGFALFFAGRHPEALAAFEKAQSLDPTMRHLTGWRYIVLASSGKSDEAKTLSAESLAKDAKSRDWVDHLLAYLAGGISDEELLAAVSKSDAAGAEAQLCEAHFYIGMQKKLANDDKGAEGHFQQALATRADRLSAYRGAQFALKKFDTAAKTF